MDFDQGNTTGAEYNSPQAWKWVLVSIATGCLAIVRTLVYFLVLVSVHAEVERNPQDNALQDKLDEKLHKRLHLATGSGDCALLKGEGLSGKPSDAP